MGTVREEFPDARLVMVGKGWGPQGPQAERELEDFVRREASRPRNLRRLARQHGGCLHGPRRFGAGVAQREFLGGTIKSLLMARPTVATRVGGMVDA